MIGWVDPSIINPSLNKNMKEKHEERICLSFTCDVGGWNSSWNRSSFRQYIPRHTAEPTCPARLRPAIHIHPLFLFLTMLQASEPRAMRQSTRHWFIHIRLSYRKQIARQHSWLTAKNCTHLQFDHRTKFGCCFSLCERACRRSEKCWVAGPCPLAERNITAHVSLAFMSNCLCLGHESFVPKPQKFWEATAPPLGTGGVTYTL